MFGDDVGVETELKFFSRARTDSTSWPGSEYLVLENFGIFAAVVV